MFVHILCGDFPRTFCRFFFPQQWCCIAEICVQCGKCSKGGRKKKRQILLSPLRENIFFPYLWSWFETSISLKEVCFVSINWCASLHEYAEMPSFSYRHQGLLGTKFKLILMYTDWWPSRSMVSNGPMSTRTDVCDGEASNWLNWKAGHFEWSFRMVCL